MSGRWKNIQNALRLASPPPSNQRHELFQLISEGKTNEVLDLLERDFGDAGGDADSPLNELKDERKRTALHWAALSTSDRNVTDVLVEKVSDRRTDGPTAMPLAFASHSHSQSFHFLLRH